MRLAVPGEFEEHDIRLLDQLCMSAAPQCISKYSRLRFP